MAITMTSAIALSMKGNYLNTLDLGNVEDYLSVNYNDTLATGTGANQADRLYHDTAALAASAVDLDLSGALTDGLGQSVAFAKIKGLFIKNKSTSAGETLKVGGGTHPIASMFNASTDEIVIGPSGCLFLWNPIDGYALTATSADDLGLDPGASTFNYDIVVWGTSA